MTRPRVLHAAPLTPWLDAQLAQAYELTHLPPAGAARAAFVAAQGGEFDAVATSASRGIANELIDAMPRLRVISSFGVGLDRIDTAHAARRGIAVGYTPELLNDCVADAAWGLLMDVARGFSAADRFVRLGRWGEGAFPLGTRVSGKRLGIVGLGRIGRVVAGRAQGFDMEIRYHNRSRVADVPYGYAETLLELARWADFLIVVSAGGADTRHLVDAEVLDALGPRGFLVNVSRGSVVDEAALVRALQQRTIAGAGLDVYENEPRVPPALMALDNVVLLPHIASGTQETRQAMAELVLANLQSFFATGQVRVAAPHA
ncbi:2-hydroxyacid dehydrogenase [Ramlibacter sp. AW1]|uniref:2-hydroxyacid dehydrogenase n=1 Tax=Ramlibacter aurantiacus TaxID=2801330 RepID=A0A936ZJX4_9BURK|nr:2-hydroxyacid dehydrogenase [Ramlibacter aurantiacus]MBL0419101.1 2-hydroxyacid dehydrogenase [Ramlibacter aurantiacus]